MVTFGQQYHTYLDQNNVFHFWQIEPNLGHEKTVWNRSLYNTAKRIFLSSSTNVSPLAPVSNHSMASHRYELSLTTSGVNVVCPGAGFSKKQIFSLDGRFIAPFNADKTTSQAMGRVK